MGCFKWLILIGAFVFMMASLIRWFEQTMEAVDERDWGRLTILIAFPFAVWWYPSRVAAGRPTAVPMHEPVRGFGKVSLTEPQPDPQPGPPASDFGELSRAAGGRADGPPPGTPKEFLGMPVVPPKKVSKKPPIDPDKIAKLKQKMIDQGMIKPPDEEEKTP